jgi:hypothetical protein
MMDNVQEHNNCINIPTTKLLYLIKVIRIIKSRRMRWAGHVPPIGTKRNAYRILMVKTEGKRPPGRPTHRLEDIKMDRRQTGWGGMDWIHLAQDRDKWKALVKTVMNLRVS